MYRDEDIFDRAGQRRSEQACGNEELPGVTGVTEAVETRRRGLAMEVDDLDGVDNRGEFCDDLGVDCLMELMTSARAFGLTRLQVCTGVQDSCNKAIASDAWK